MDVLAYKVVHKKTKTINYVYINVYNIRKTN